MQNREITSFDIDILGEVGNIGAGNAATALSEILNKKVLLNIPSVQICKLNDITSVMGGAEAVRVGAFFGVTDALNGYVLFMVEESDAEKIKNIAANGYDIDACSVFSEIANIISGAYVGSLATMINDKIDITPPEVCKDMLGSLVDSLVASVLSVADKTVIISTSLVIDGDEVSGFYVLLLEEESLNKMLDYFNKISKL